MGSGEWQNVKRYTGSSSEGTAFVDISDVAAGHPDVKVRWRYYNANYAWFWAIDNVEFFVPAPAGVGDINSDGTINISDVILSLRIAVRLDVTVGGKLYSPPYPEELLELADMNGDTLVDISDNILILRESLDL